MIHHALRRAAASRSAALLLLSAMMIGGITGCGARAAPATSGARASGTQQTHADVAAAEPARRDLVTVVISTTAGDITLELDRARAPVSVDNFLMYAARASYDGCIFHRVIPGFVIQSGGFDPPPHMAERAKLDEARGMPDTPIINEWRNGLKNLRGTIGMARDNEPDSATREWYINLADNAKLDIARPDRGGAGYAVFGRVTKGMDVVDKIAAGKTHAMPERDMNDVPDEPVAIRRVRRADRAP